MINIMTNMLKKSLDYITKKTNIKPQIAIILGSGLGSLAREIRGIAVPYREIPGFKASSVAGHAGNLIIGELGAKKVVAMQGRLHFYEGYELADIVYPVQVMKALGAQKLIVTNASGGINTAFKQGDLMLIEDHINFTGKNPLKGPEFIDMTEVYSKKMLNIAEKTAEELKLNIQKGVYSWVTGPSYETPAEIRMLRTLGADAVGMSTVPEVIIARHEGLEVLGISCITNMAAGVLGKPLSHEEVMETAKKVEEAFTGLVKEVVNRLDF